MDTPLTITKKVSQYKSSIRRKKTKTYDAQISEEIGRCEGASTKQTDADSRAELRPGGSKEEELGG